MRNPHFDDGLVVWRDEYSGRYSPPPTKYDNEFDLQWRIALEGNQEYYRHPGASLEDAYIADRIYEWTGKHPDGTDFHDPSSGSRVLDHPIDEGLIRGKDCIDVGCGMGRWTRTMLALGARSVLSIDLSESALKSVSRYNPNWHKANVMTIPQEHREWVAKFDFANFWGVAMSTHDPRRAFLSAASTVKLGGALYLMVYCPEGLHATEETALRRRRFHELKTVAERLAYVDRVYDRRWDSSLSLPLNLRNLWANLRGSPKGGKIGVLDLLEPYYNWVIPLEVIQGWMRFAGFDHTILLNEHEAFKCAYHVLGMRTSMPDLGHL
jgi:SAM-dependent methyltransferase